MTSSAEAELAEIWSYLAVEASEVVATRLVNKVKDCSTRFCEFPHSGASREQLAKGLRVGFSDSYAIYYQFSSVELTVVRVLHGSRDASAIAADGGFG